jgi:choline dehydrogenase-like flavoprotein
VGGRSIHWNAVSLRFAARDFRERSLQGIEEDWPLTYEELAPDYSHVERMIGVTGTRENLDIVPDGEFLPGLKLRCSEEIVKQTCAKMGIRLIPARKAVLTIPTITALPLLAAAWRVRRAPCSHAGVNVPQSRKTGNFR